MIVSLALAQVDRTRPVRQKSDSTARRRILGDTIEASYTALTTKFTYQQYIKNNDVKFFHPDTIPDNFHRMTDLERNRNFIQNLGNIGTAIRPLFYDAPKQIGASSGFNSFNEFYTGPDQIRYFDTRSPYSDITANFGGGGRARTSIIFAMNDSTRMSIGFGYKSIRADKQLAFLQRGDRNVEGTDWNIFGYLRPIKWKKYNLLFNLTQMKHEVTELGGIIPVDIDPDPEANLFNYQDANVILSDAITLEKRGGLHIYHQYSLDSAFQLYQEANYYSQIDRYTDIYNRSTSDSLLYQEVDAQSTDTIQDRTTFKEIQSEFGIKGRTSKFAYSAFYRYRNLSYENVNLPDNKIRDTEHFVGGTLRQQISPKVFLSARGEFLFDGNYSLSGDFTSDFFDASFTRAESKPSYLSLSYKGQQSEWTNSFSNEVSDNLRGNLKLGTERISFRPGLRFNRISNMIYFDSNKLAAQASSDIILLSPGIDFDWKLSEKWTWKNTAYYNSVSGGSGNLYRIPEVMGNSQLAMKNVLFDGKMIIHLGMDFHFRSSYQPYDYNPITQQFYLQDSFTADSFVKADFFFNFKVQNFFLFLKMEHLNQGILSDGYFLTPYYTGGRRTFNMGMRWSFFD